MAVDALSEHELRAPRAAGVPDRAARILLSHYVYASGLIEGPAHDPELSRSKLRDVLEQTHPWLLELCAELPRERQLALALEGQEEAVALAQASSDDECLAFNDPIRYRLRQAFVQRSPRVVRIHVPARFEARPRGRRPRSRGRARAPSREPDEPAPPLGGPQRSGRRLGGVR